MAMDSEQRSGARAGGGGGGGGGGGSGGGGGGGYYEFLRKLYGPGPGAAPKRSVLGADVNWLLELGPVPLELDPQRRAQVDPQTLPLVGNAETHLMASNWAATRPHDLLDLSLRLPALAFADPAGECSTSVLATSDRSKQSGNSVLLAEVTEEQLEREERAPPPPPEPDEYVRACDELGVLPSLHVRAALHTGLVSLVGRSVDLLGLRALFVALAVLVRCV